jgi:hypothetical protein
MGRLPNQDAANGWTDELVIKYTDFTETTDDTAQTFTYAVKAGDMVTDVAARLRTAFNDSGGGDELDVIVGDGSGTTSYLTLALLHTDGTEITYVANTGAYIDNENGKLYTGADTIDFKFTPNASTGQSYNLAELTAGEIVFKMRIVRIDE